MGPSSEPRTPSRLSDSLHHRLNMYALAASAAGVGVLSLSQSAEAKVVYTPAHKWLPVNQYYYLDLNHDGVNDFRFYLGSYSTVGIYRRNLIVEPQWENAVYGFSGGTCRAFCASALPKGIKVGPKSRFVQRFPWMFQVSNSDGLYSWGRWRNVTKSAYLGLKFAIKGKFQYGWARLGHISHNKPVRALLMGYAYETVPNKPIITGKTKGPDVITVEPATLGTLALGRK